MAAAGRRGAALSSTGLAEGRDSECLGCGAPHVTSHSHTCAHAGQPPEGSAVQVAPVPSSGFRKRGVWSSPYISLHSSESVFSFK